MIAGAARGREGDPMTPHGVLLAAAREIRRRGWRQEGDNAPLSALCVIAAVLVVDRAGVTMQLRHDALTLLCERLGLANRLELADWNNDAARTVGDVLAVLEAPEDWRNTTPELFRLLGDMKRSGQLAV